MEYEADAPLRGGGVEGFRECGSDPGHVMRRHDATKSRGVVELRNLVEEKICPVA